MLISLVSSGSSSFFVSKQTLLNILSKEYRLNVLTLKMRKTMLFHGKISTNLKIRLSNSRIIYKAAKFWMRSSVSSLESIIETEICSKRITTTIWIIGKIIKISLETVIKKYALTFLGSSSPAIFCSLTLLVKRLNKK